MVELVEDSTWQDSSERTKFQKIAQQVGKPVGYLEYRKQFICQGTREAQGARVTRDQARRYVRLHEPPDPQPARHGTDQGEEGQALPRPCFGVTGRADQKAEAELPLGTCGLLEVKSASYTHRHLAHNKLTRNDRWYVWDLNLPAGPKSGPMWRAEVAAVVPMGISDHHSTGLYPQDMPAGSK